MKIYTTPSEALKGPNLIRLSRNLFTLSFHVMKLLPAIHILKKAFERKEIDEKTLIVETSSGSFAYGVALACTELGLRFNIVTDPQMEPSLLKQLLNQNGEVIIVEKPAVKGGMQQARLDVLFDIMRRSPSSFWPCQYDNPGNPDAYTEVGVDLRETFGDDLILISPVGSGGSSSGMISAIREKEDRATLVGVDTFNSVLFGQDDGQRHLIGLGNSILPKNLIHEKFDEVHWVSSDEAFYATLFLHKHYGLFCGPTTGAAYPVAKWLADNHPNRNVIFISPDSGHRYLDTVYNSQWRDQHRFCQATYPSAPKLITHPNDNDQTWSYLPWNRRTLDEVNHRLSFIR
jgi:cysteine synthase